jgi:cytidylate kinase
MKKSDSTDSTLLVERQMLLARVRNLAASPTTPISPSSRYRFITITRDVGALGDEVATALAGHLHWHHFDREIVDYIAQDNHVRQDLVRELDETAQNLIHDTVQRLLRTAAGISFGNQEYHQSLLKTLALLAARGDAVIVGRGSVYALQGEPGIHIRIFSSPEVRVQRLAARWGVTPEEARHRMEKVDADRRSFRQHHFGKSVEDLGFFDAVFNTDHLQIEWIVQSILSMFPILEQSTERPAGMPSWTSSQPIAGPSLTEKH